MMSLKRSVFLCYLLLQVSFITVVKADLKFDPFASREEIIVTPAPQPEAAAGSVEVTQETWTASLMSIIQAGEDSMANVDGNIVSIGETYKGYTLTKVNKQSVVFSKGSQKITLTIEDN